MFPLVTVLMGLWASASARRRHGDVATRRRNTGQVAGLKKNAGLPLMVNLGVKGGGWPLTAPPAWGQDPLAMCACSRENNQAPQLAARLQRREHPSADHRRVRVRHATILRHRDGHFHCDGHFHRDGGLDRDRGVSSGRVRPVCRGGDPPPAVPWAPAPGALSSRAARAGRRAGGR